MCIQFHVGTAVVVQDRRQACELWRMSAEGRKGDNREGHFRQNLRVGMAWVWHTTVQVQRL